MKRLPLAPLLAGRTLNQLAEEVGVRPRQFYRWRHEGGVPDRWADRLAVATGRHPAEVWPEWLIDAAPWPTCSEHEHVEPCGRLAEARTQMATMLAEAYR